MIVKRDRLVEAAADDLVTDFIGDIFDLEICGQHAEAVLMSNENKPNQSHSIKILTFK